MAKRPRRNHGAVFKAKGALEALKGDQTIVELAERFYKLTSSNNYYYAFEQLKPVSLF